MKINWWIFLLCAISSVLMSQISYAANTPLKPKSAPVKKRPPPPPKTFDQQYLQFLRRWQIPGSSIAIIKKDKFILSRGYGWSNIERRQPVTPNSVFRVASVSKAITAVAILKLIQEGKLSLDSKVYTILNDLQPLNNQKPTKYIQNITVKHLLEMSSGWITDKGVDPMLGPWSGKMLQHLNNQIPPDCKTAARMMMTIPMQYPPGTFYSYSNINYCLLGLIINKITRFPGAFGYENYVKKNLFTPFGITSLRIGDNTPGKQPANEVHYYFYEPKNQPPNLDRIYDGLPYGQTRLLQKNYSDGGWVGSAPDLAKFVNALGKNKILTTKSIKIMTTQPPFKTKKDSYFAKGWSVKNINGRRFMLKTGSFTGTQALVMLEQDGTAYAALFNIKPSNRKLFLAQLENMLTTYAAKN